MTATTAHPQEPQIALPARRMVLAIAVASGATALAWTVVVWAILGRPEVVTAGLAGAALVAAVCVAGALAMRPWRARALSSWTTTWLAGTVLRLVMTPLVAYLLYSATPLDLAPLMLSVAATYVIVQISEAAALAAYIKRIS